MNISFEIYSKRVKGEESFFLDVISGKELFCRIFQLFLFW